MSVTIKAPMPNKTKTVVKTVAVLQLDPNVFPKFFHLKVESNGPEIFFLSSFSFLKQFNESVSSKQTQQP